MKNRFELRPSRPGAAEDGHIKMPIPPGPYIQLSQFDPLLSKEVIGWGEAMASAKDYQWLEEFDLSTGKVTLANCGGLACIVGAIYDTSD